MTRFEEGHYRPEQLAALAGWLDALDQRNTPLEQIAKGADDPLRADLKRLDAVFKAARKMVRDSKAPLPERVPAVRLLGRGLDHQDEDRGVLADLLAPQTAEELQTAAVAALGQVRGPRSVEALLKGWKSCTPKLRSQVLDVLLGRPDGPDVVFSALGKKHILPQDVSLTARRRLQEHLSKRVRERAGKVFTDLVDADRNKVVLAYEPVLRLKGDTGRGLALFTKHCATCHRLGMVGQEVGPDLAAVRDKPAEWFLPALFDPSRAVEARYLNYTAVTKQGRVFTGVLAEESGSSLTLVGPTGQRQVILRANLEELSSTGKSAMPDGLEKDLKPQDVADLIAYLREQKK